MLRNIRCCKKIMAPILALTLVSVITSTAVAIEYRMPWDEYGLWHWYSQFDTNSIGSYYSRQTRLIQRACNAISGSELDADGIFGSLTEDAVELIQYYAGIYVDGICGVDTWYAYQYSYLWYKSSCQYWSSKGVYYYYYYSIGESGNKIRHCSNEYWYALDDDGVNWYKVY